MLAQVPHNPLVVGSNPTRPTIVIRALQNNRAVKKTAQSPYWSPFVQRCLGLGLALFFCLSAVAQAPKPMKSFGFRSSAVPCARSAEETARIVDLMPLDPSGNLFAPPARPGAGVQRDVNGEFIFPTGSFSIRRVCVAHWISGNQTDAYAMAGHSGPNGDLVSPPVVGTGKECAEYPADAPVVFTAGDYLDVHAGCLGDSHWIVLLVWYTQP